MRLTLYFHFATVSGFVYPVSKKDFFLFIMHSEISITAFRYMLIIAE